jgi:MEDS: MEthanogen/methylotroph, DcmR Sensory domain/Histidine kinase-like ATPase domain
MPGATAVLPSKRGPAVSAESQSTLRHLALFYRSDHDFVEGVGSFVRQGLESGEAVMVAVPGRKVGMLRDDAGEGAGAVTWFDMVELGRNPARIIPAIRGFIDANPDRTARMVGEPIWRGRSDSETVEATHHEALINLAFADADVTILCPYDLALADETLCESHRTHPVLLEDGLRSASESYAADRVAEVGNDALEPVPGSAETLAYGDQLPALRAALLERLQGMPISPDRRMDMLVAVNEAAGNSLRHSGRPAQVRLWLDNGSVVCEVASGGHVQDPLAGRRSPLPTAESGRGLWMINQLCDLSQLRSDRSGTTLRLLMAV